jgi:cell filamentation protein
MEISSRDEWPETINGIRGLDGLDKEDITYASLDNPQVQQIYKTYRAQPINSQASPDSDD